VLVGLTRFGETAAFEAFPFVDGGRRILGSNYGSAVAAVDFPRYAEAYLAGRLPIDRLIDRHLSLDELEDAFDRLRAGRATRQVVVFGD
jgi:S-(hydroxymethyl)glutathione dehydrogenase/alcohol dehydrogenase